MPWGAIAGAVVGGLFQQSAADTAADAQRSSNDANIAEQRRVREQLRADTEAQRAIADQAFSDYKAGLIDYATAQQRAATAMQGLQQTIAQSQLSDVQKTQAMAQFTPYGIKTGTGQTFFNPQTGQAGVTLSPEMQQYQQSLYGQLGGLAGGLTATNPLYQQYGQGMLGQAIQAQQNIQQGLTPEQQAIQNAMYGKAGEAVGGLAVTPEQAAQKYYQQQMDVLAPQRQAEDIALRQQQLQRGRIGLGVASEAAGAGAGGMLNPEQFGLQRAREQANAQIAAQATQAGQQQATSQAALAQNLLSGAQGVTAADQARLLNQINATQGLFGAGTGTTAAQQREQANNLALMTGIYGAGVTPEQQALANLSLGSQLGAQQATAGYNLANLYNQGMTPYYANLLAAQQTAGQGMLAVPLAQQTGAQEAYNRQQSYLSGLQGSNLPYQAMNLGTPTIPGSAYAMAGLGSGISNIGLRGLQNVNWNNMFGTPQPVNALDTSAYGSGLGGYNAAMTDIYGY
jgi:hypothetical protein